MRLNGLDLRQRLLEARRQTLQRLVAKRRGDGILFNEALAEEGSNVFVKACELWPRGDRVEAGWQLLQERAKPQLAEN